MICDSVRVIPNGVTAFSTILVDAQGERLVVPFYDPQLDPTTDWLPLEQLDRAATVLCDMRWPLGSEALLLAAKRQGVPSILDADVAPVADLKRLIPLADHLLFSQPALDSLIESGDPAQKLRRIAEQVSAAVIGVTLGAQGALIWERANGSLQHYPTIPITAVDTLNAGDVWHGTYALGLALGWDTATRVKIANIAAAVKCEQFGGWTGAPDRVQLLARAKRTDVEVDMTGVGSAEN